MFETTGKILILGGIFLIISGLVFLFWYKLPFLKLPGNIFMESGNFRFIFPLAVSLFISLILTVILNVVLRLFR